MSYKVTYFDAQGRGEPIRFILSYGGADFEDNRIPQADWSALKPDAPFGQLPLLEHEGKTGNQTKAICRYLAKQFKLVGNNDWEDLEIDATVDTTMDLFEKIVIGKKATETLEEQFQQEDIAYFLKKIDEQIKKNNGYMAVGRLTWADLFTGSIALQLISRSGNEDLFAGYPNINENIRTVQNLPKIKEWIFKHPAKT